MILCCRLGRVEIVHPRRQGPALLCGPSTLPLAVAPVLIGGLMSRAFLAVMLTLVSLPLAWGGPIADQFGSGYGGVPWGLSLAKLVGMVPGGDHYFSTALGHREYSIRNDEPFLGVPRPGTRIQYGLGTDGGIESVAIGFPYDRREELLGALYSQFGRAAQINEVGTAVIYRWAQDGEIRIAVRASRDSQYGILELWIQHVTPQAQKAHVGGAS